MSIHGCSPQEVWEYINGLERLGMHLGLERVTELVEALGSPQKTYRTIHVVGTNGKSSTTRFISALLEAQGMKVGAYVSPHLVSLAERQMVNSVPSSDAEFCELVARVRPVAEKLDRTFPPGDALTQFEILTAAALLYFKEQACDVAVIEAGLGGRLDATSVIDSDVQVITTIGLEHTELLGDTPSAILKEKAAVIPEKGKVVAGLLSPDLKAELRDLCTGKDARCHFLGDEFVVLADPRAESFDVFGLYACYTDLRLKVLGSYQRANAALAVAAAEMFVGEELDGGSVRTALASTGVPGRLEVISTQPLCIFDGSHNPPGMEETMRSLEQILERRRLIAVVSILRDKEAREMMRLLVPSCDIVFATQSASPRALTADELAAIISSLGKGPEVFVDPDPRSAMMSAYRLATSNQVVLVTGSFTLISDLKRGLN
ncbi:MAG: bifunctional folylpolyglutamate synthase/dihydrofolate synthase [Thermoleophilia bacterium]|nr:bifunctional folylpolyglutamate synthase/dihydrofolate synthase [Thermoleophilia bacterium]